MNKALCIWKEKFSSFFLEVFYTKYNLSFIPNNEHQTSDPLFSSPHLHFLMTSSGLVSLWEDFVMISWALCITFFFFPACSTQTYTAAQAGLELIQQNDCSYRLRPTAESMRCSIMPLGLLSSGPGTYTDIHTAWYTPLLAHNSVSAHAHTGTVGSFNHLLCISNCP